MRKIYKNEYIELRFDFFKKDEKKLFEFICGTWKIFKYIGFEKHDTIGKVGIPVKEKMKINTLIKISKQILSI